MPEAPVRETPPPPFGRAAATIALAAAAASARRHGRVQCIVLVDCAGRLMAHAASRTDGPPASHLLDRAWRAGALSIETDGFGSEHGPELASCRQCAGPRAPSALPLRCDGTLIGAIAVTSDGDAPNFDVAEAGRSALRIFLSGGTA